LSAASGWRDQTGSARTSPRFSCRSLPSAFVLTAEAAGLAATDLKQWARVGFLPRPGSTFGVLARVHRTANLHFTTSSFTGQAYATCGLRKDDKPYAPMFAIPPITAGSVVIPVKAM
jgi:hypothetical protein